MPTSNIQLHPRAKARIYKLKDDGYDRPYLWVSILTSGTFGVFRTWAEALEHQGAQIVGDDARGPFHG